MRKTKTFAVLTAFIVLISLFACTGGEEVHNIEFEVIDNFSEQLLNYNINSEQEQACSCCQGRFLIAIPETIYTFEQYDYATRSEGYFWIGRIAVIGDHQTVLDPEPTVLRDNSHTITTIIVLEQFFSANVVGNFVPGDTMRIRESYHVRDGELILGAFNPLSTNTPLIAGEEYIVFLPFINKMFPPEPILVDGELIDYDSGYDVFLSNAFPVTDREDNQISLRFESSIHQANVSAFGASEANELRSFRQMLVNGAREKYLGIAPPVSGQPGLAEE